MMKKIISLMLCLLMVASVFAGCAKEEDPNDKGAYVTMYLTDPIYDFDPASAYENEAALRVVGLLFETLFVLDDNGKVKPSLAEDYDVNEDKDEQQYEMIITLKEGTAWSDGVALTANDVVYAWKRILNESNSFGAAAMLYDIKNARAVKAGELSVDKLGLSALNNTEVQILFEGPIDYEQFVMNLTSVALAPIREDVVKRTEMENDWAKKSTVMASSGAFRLKEMYYADNDPSGLSMVLERNQYYFRDVEEDDIDESVTPYRLIIDYTKSDEEIMQAYQNGELFFVGDIPLSVRGSWKDSAEVTDAMSTHTYVLNHNAVVRYYDADEFEDLSSAKSVYDSSLVDGVDGKKIFADAKVRQALSLAIDRTAIANAVVFAKAASGLVPYGVFETDSAKKSFRENGGELIASGANIAQATQLLSDAGVNAGEYMFAISVPSYDEVHLAIANMVKASWESLGFHVAINAIEPKENRDDLISIDDVLEGVKDDIFAENYRAGLFEVAAIDYTAYSADAFSVLAPFAQGFSGNASAKEVDTGNTDEDGNKIYSFEHINPLHHCNYASEDYKTLIENAFAEKDVKKRASILHDAEKRLIEDAAVIPIVFNENAVLISEELSKYEFTYYGVPVMKKMKLKDYMLYIPKEDETTEAPAEVAS